MERNPPPSSAPAIPDASPADAEEHATDVPDVPDVSNPPGLTIIEQSSTPYICPTNHVLVTREGEGNILQQLVFGRPLRAEDVSQDAIGKRTGLALFASDMLASATYATHEILYVLILAGTAALSLSIPIAGAIGLLLLIVTLSYRQIIFAYPEGGGAYTVARDHLGAHAAQVAGAALLIDYVLTLAVSTAAAAEHMVSAFPALLPYRISLSVGMILLITLFNLRGTQQPVRLIVVCTYVFMGAALLLLGVGFWRWSAGTLPTVAAVALPQQATHALTLFLVLRAFSSGAIALTGIEAISSGVAAFREPRSRNAAFTLLLTSGLLMLLFLGITVLAHQVGARPLEHETVLSQLGRAVFDKTSVLYVLLIGATTLLLAIAANTSYLGFQRQAAAQAADGFLPRQFGIKGYRLSFSWGIAILAVSASLLIVLFDARTTALIPLYAIGVFVSFTLAQAGMVMRWRMVGRLGPDEEACAGRSLLRYDPRWKVRLLINAAGCLVTAVVTLVFVVSKFTHGAWIAVVVMGALVWLFFLVRRHYTDVARSLSLDNYRPEADIVPARHTVVILVAGVHRGTLGAVRYARTINADRLLAVHVETDAAQMIRVQERWNRWIDDIPLVVIDSPYRMLLKPLVNYINTLADDSHTDLVTIVIPQFVCVRWWHQLLHNQTALLIRSAFLFDRKKVVIEVPYRLEA